MDNTDPQPQLPNDLPSPGVVQSPPLEVIQPGKPPQTSFFQGLRNFWIKYAPRASALLGSLRGKIALGAVAAAVAGGTYLHFAHRKPVAPPIKHVQVGQTAHMRGHRYHKHEAKQPVHKAVKSPSKTTAIHKKHSKKTSKPKPWFSKKTSE